MGADDFYPDEAPVRREQVEPFWIDETPVTNAVFAQFVGATDHVTFAEKALNPADYPQSDPALTQPASLVFVPPEGPTRLDIINWWQLISGADWRHPLGPDSSIDNIPDHPVVHISIGDALAFATWAGKSLPTEVEWERAARGGLDHTTYAWGEEFMPGGSRMAKTWEGAFPFHNAAPADRKHTGPVKFYPSNGYGVYDMIGNVWELTGDLYGRVASPSKSPKCCGASPSSAGDRYVLKGGSHLCAPEYCQRYRPAARWPQPADTTTSHAGFRCVLRDNDRA
jgi:formylglycine-generating enzyme required for sulfatase activity